MEWLTRNPALASVVRRVALIALGVVLAEAADLAGMPPEDRAALRERLCSELFWSSHGLPPLTAPSRQ